MSLLAARGVHHGYRRFSLVGAGRVTPVLESVDLDIAPGETLALLGRSGCGKSTLSRLLVGLETPTSGEVRFEGRPLQNLAKTQWQALRRSVQMVFQDPLGAVNPRARVAEIIGEPLEHLCELKGTARRDRVVELLEAVGLDAGDADKYPQQMSGGQLQRVCIARALAPRPKLIILDEAVSNLDLHLQIRMLSLFEQLQREHEVAYLFITHDLRLVERFCSRVVVMEAGRIVENTPVTRPLRLTTHEGRALQDAVLPALPRQMRIAHESNIK
ncbi:nickel import ATP-binding protein NikE [Halomonas sp. MCCC 1A11062]|uniref:nickel import ATP-binding protein NikE n=1 Tax=Halomonas sp. MCCC 1A11062 TaxID=2733485 RepID=UPI001F2E31A3|nr:nickel import ATP-binding protein NikE [Halomonas sp. MCCC 1A11062]MCE8040189.1 nickel import ATP-binding protein NikE [Halomonas sp. MCCC 1A11062]